MTVPKSTEARGRTPIIPRACIIRIGKAGETRLCSRSKEQSKPRTSLEVPKDMIDNIQIRHTQGMHKLAHETNSKSEI